MLEVPEVVERDAEADPVAEEVADVPEPEVFAADPVDAAGRVDPPDAADAADPADPADADPCALAGAGVTFGVGNGVCNET